MGASLQVGLLSGRCGCAWAQLHPGAPGVLRPSSLVVIAFDALDFFFGPEYHAPR